MLDGLKRYARGHGLALFALFLALGGSAYAVAKIDSGEIKNNSIKTKDIKDNKGVTGKDVKDDSLTGADVNESTLNTARVVARLGGALNLAAPLNGDFAATAIPGSWEQQADELDLVQGTATINFPAGCDGTLNGRFVSLFITRPGANLNDPNLANDDAKLVGIGTFSAINDGPVSETRTALIGLTEYFGAQGIFPDTDRAEPGAPATRTLEAHINGDCDPGSTAGPTVTDLKLTVLGFR